MFTGLVQDLGRVVDLDTGRMRVATRLVSDLGEGDSISVNGVCLTATDLDGESFGADVMPETFRRSSLGTLAPGDRVNLELPPRAADRMGGHVVQGHVDGVGEVTQIGDEGNARLVTVSADPDLLRYVVEKGSIAIDGVSLTVASVGDDGFSVSLIPETLERTNLGTAATGTRVNLEVDVLAKYVEKLLRV